MKRIRLEDATVTMLEEVAKEGGESYDACIRRLCGEDGAVRGKLRQDEKEVLSAAKRTTLFKTVNVTAYTNAMLDVYTARCNEGAEKKASKANTIYRLVVVALKELLSDD